MDIPPRESMTDRDGYPTAEWYDLVVVALASEIGAMPAAKPPAARIRQRHMDRLEAVRSGISARDLPTLDEQRRALDAATDAADGLILLWRQPPATHPHVPYPQSPSPHDLHWSSREGFDPSRWTKE